MTREPDDTLLRKFFFQLLQERVKLGAQFGIAVHPAEEQPDRFRYPAGPEIQDGL